MGHVTITTPHSGTICHRCAGTSYDLQQCIKFEISMFTHYEDMRVDENAEIGVVWGQGSLKVIGNLAIR